MDLMWDSDTSSVTQSVVQELKAQCKELLGDPNILK